MRFLRWMRRNDRLSADELQRLHERLLVKHLRHAAATVPFYSRLVDPDAIRGPEDLERFPVLDKAAVRAAGRDLVSKPLAKRVFQLETGGSSGEPLRFYTDRERESSQLACKLRSRLWWGVGPEARETDLWGSPIERRPRGWLRSLSERALGFQLLSAFKLDERTMAAFKTRLARGRCDLLYGYPSALARYGRFLLARGEDLKDLPLKLVVCTAETLVPADAEVIRRVISCPLANEYGCRDGGLIAHEGPEGFHLQHDAVHVELLDESGRAVGPGEVGEVVLTNLHARAAPLIRYRLGDRMCLDPSPPAEGNPHPRIREVAGRITDSLVRDDGARTHGLALIYILRELPGVDRFRCIQDAPGRVLIEVVPGEDFDPRSVETGVIDRVHRVLGAGTEVDLRILPDLEPHPSGKHHYIICNVP